MRELVEMFVLGDMLYKIAAEWSQELPATKVSPRIHDLILQVEFQSWKAEA